MEFLSGTGLALIEGFLLALSPCILPILPIIFGSSSIGGKLRSVAMIGGFITSFTIFALISRSLLIASGISVEAIQLVSFSLLFLLGLVMVVPMLEDKFMMLTSELSGKAQSISAGKYSETVLGGFIVGTLIGVVWVPCAGPILAAAILQVIQAEAFVQAAWTIFAFSVGAGVPMLAIALLGQRLSTGVKSLSKYTKVLRRTMGALVIIFALFGLIGFNVGVYVELQLAEAELARELAMEP